MLRRVDDVRKLYHDDYSGDEVVVWRNYEQEELEFNARLFGGPGLLKRLLLMVSNVIPTFKGVIVWTQSHAQWVFRVHKVQPSPDHVYELPKGMEISLPPMFEYKGEMLNTREVLYDTRTRSLVVLHQGKIVYEEYTGKGSIDQPWMVFSLSKTITSTAIGILLNEGKIESLDDLVTKYLPELENTAWDTSTIKEVLTMRAGARESRIGVASDIILGTSLLKTIQKLKRRDKSTFMYLNNNAIVISILVERVSKMDIAEYLAERLWIPLGVQDSLYVLKDNKGASNGSGWILSARDCAKYGELFRNNGVNHEGTTLVQPSWVAEATTEQTTSTGIIVGDFKYGYFWWTRDGVNDYMASGAFTNNLYVNPAKEVTIVYFASMPNEKGVLRSDQIHELFRSIASQF